MADWRWKLRLFLSADLVGSTAFKQSKSGIHSPQWAPVFKEFFTAFPYAVEAAYQDLPSQCPMCSEHPRAWKFSGDEVLFWVELKGFCEVVTHIAAFKKALNAFPIDWQKKGVPLKLKGTAWLAGFPVTNTELEIPIDSNGTQALDFIGPSIDLGFRIARFSESRRMVVSADLALMLLDAVDKLEVDRTTFHMHLHGRESLRGMHGSEPYPIIWLDMLDGKPDLEERLLGVHRDFRSDDLKDYLRRFIDDAPQLKRPFIDGEADPRYGTPDDGLGKKKVEMEAELSDRNYTVGKPPDEPPEGAEKHLKDPPESLKPPELTLGSF